MFFRRQQQCKRNFFFFFNRAWGTELLDALLKSQSSNSLTKRVRTLKLGFVCKQKDLEKDGVTPLCMFANEM